MLCCSFVLSFSFRSGSEALVVEEVETDFKSDSSSGVNNDAECVSTLLSTGIVSEFGHMGCSATSFSVLSTVKFYEKESFKTFMTYGS